ncbi:hypothetical protein Dda3937_00710 [Dickeya dadantii 3937]|uniref:Uncharacterized protein n=1 Tax=Dickeya dadantii (strain 3937) TaxID=198628 RepID=E0SHF1_DICD3|nr:hypothetical protein Dda3937_00710 [Dickeya dadantii 3937]
MLDEGVFFLLHKYDETLTRRESFQRIPKLARNPVQVKSP